MEELISNESCCFCTLCSRERSMTEGKQTFGAVGSSSSPCWWWVTRDFTSDKLTCLSTITHIHVVLNPLSFISSEKHKISLHSVYGRKIKELDIFPSVHKQHSNTFYYVADLKSALDIEDKVMFSECHHREMVFCENEHAYVNEGWELMFLSEQVLDAPLHCIISRFDLNGFGPQRCPRRSRSVEMLLFCLEG